MPGFRHLHLILLAVVTSVTLFACGGGSSSDPAPDPGNNGGGNTNQPASITESDAVAIARAVYTAVFTIDDVAGLANPTVANNGIPSSPKSQSSLQATEVSPEIPCEDDGFSIISITGDDPVAILGGDLSTGDSINLFFDGCDEFGVITDGEVDMAIVEVIPDILDQNAKDWELLSADLTFTEFSLTVNEETTTLNADMTLTSDLRNFPAVAINTISGSTINERSSAGTSTTMTDFEISTEIDESIPESTMLSTSGFGFLTSSEFEGEVSFNIEQDVVSQNTDNPMDGVMKIFGANGGSISVTQFNSQGALLYVDPEGDGAPIVITVPWSELL